MDLIALGTSSNSNFISSALDGGDSAYNNNNSGCILSSSIAESIAVHRIISWQSLLQLKNDQLTSKSSQIVGGTENYGICVEDIERECVHETDNNNNDEDEDEDDDNLESLIKGATTVTWSPDGRNVAVGLVDGGILIHTVEPNNDNAHHEVGGTAGGDGGDGDGGQSILHIIRPPPTNLKDKPSILSPAAGSRNPTNLTTEGDVTNATISDNKQNKKKPTASPRVTRSMAAAREPGGGSSGGGGSGSKKKKSSRRSKSPGSSSSLSRRKPNLKVDTKNLLQSTAIIGMVWNRLVHRQQQYHQRNDDNNDSRMKEEEESEIRECWKYTSQLIDRSAYFLPPPSSSTTIRDGGGGRGMNLFSSMAHLNVLCVATPEEVHWYVQGQYRILSVEHGLQQDSGGAGGGMNGIGGGIDLVCSPDLSTLLAVTKQATTVPPIATPSSTSSSKKVRVVTAAESLTGPMKAKLFHTSLLPRKRYELQILSASYKSIFSHLSDAKSGMQSALTSWKAALRPLDTKFNGLIQLLSKYQVNGIEQGGGGGGSDLIRCEFLQFILSGRSTITGNASSALDQFFTRAHMHDQLLQREARGVEASAASMEGALRSRVLSSIRAVVYEAEELYGLAKAQEQQGTTTDDSSSSNSSSSLIDAKTALCLYNASRILFLTFNQLLGYVVEARIRLHDLLCWIRSTASQVRAWGTASDSIQRQNAKARRISNGVVQRVSGFLSNSMLFTLKGLDYDSGMDHRILTECIIGVPLSVSRCMEDDLFLLISLVNS